MTFIPLLFPLSLSLYPGPVTQGESVAPFPHTNSRNPNNTVILYQKCVSYCAPSISGLVPIYRNDPTAGPVSTHKPLHLSLYPCTSTLNSFPLSLCYCHSALTPMLLPLCSVHVPYPYPCPLLLLSLRPTHYCYYCPFSIFIHCITHLEQRITIIIIIIIHKT